MKNIKIFPKDWLQLHPYKQSRPVDSYYTNIANRIYDIMLQTELSNSFEGDETKQICIRLAAYFEDVISGLNIWRSFSSAYQELYGKYVPFYTPDDHYYDDEVNFEDVRFLLWHYTQQYHGYRKGTFVNPDNPVNEWTARLIYNMFCDEWTTAPENERMQVLFSPETRYDDQEKYEPLLIWFHYNSYLLTDSNTELTEQTKEMWKENRSTAEQLNEMIMGVHQRLAYVSKTSLLALTSPQWLARILPENHPDMEFIKAVANDSMEVVPEELKERNQLNYDKFMKASEGKPFVYLEKTSEAEAFIKEKVGMEIKEDFRLPASMNNKKLAVYATPQEGIEVLSEDVASIKDANNPYYSEEEAKEKALGFFIVKHVSIYALKEMEEKGYLADACTKSLISDERGKAIIHDNWQFLSRYFIREYPRY